VRIIGRSAPTSISSSLAAETNPSEPQTKHVAPAGCHEAGVDAARVPFQPAGGSREYVSVTSSSTFVCVDDVLRAAHRVQEPHR
jgi:hypothetical protein